MKNYFQKRNVLLFLLMSIFSLINAQTIYVSPQGNDKNPGTKDKPVATFGKAQMLARKLPVGKDVIVLFANGIYYLKPLCLHRMIIKTHP